MKKIWEKCLMEKFSKRFSKTFMKKICEKYLQERSEKIRGKIVP
jgi:ribosomal protein S17E